MALPIAYYAYRHDAPLRISTVIAPWVGRDNLDGAVAKVIDVLAVFATIGGVATTLGLVGSQFLVGIEWMTGASVGDLGTILVITGLTVAFTISVALGVEKGIRRISYFNMALFAVVTVATFVLGPTGYIREPEGSGVRVRTDRGEYTADDIVIASGAWAYKHVDALEGLAVLQRQVLSWLQPQEPERFVPENFPVWNLQVEEGRFYGLPIVKVPGSSSAGICTASRTSTPTR